MTYYVIQYFDYELSGETISSYLFPRIFDNKKDAEVTISQTGYASTNGDYWEYLKEHDAHDTYLADDDDGDYVMIHDDYVIATAQIVPMLFTGKENAQ